jgi:hypothetical protein
MSSYVHISFYVLLSRMRERYIPRQSRVCVVQSPRKYSNYCIEHCPALWHSSDVPTSSDAKIKELFGQAMAAKDEAELKRVAKELRAAITEHARVTRRPLLTETSMLTAAESSGD